MLGEFPGVAIDPRNPICCRQLLGAAAVKFGDGDKFNISYLQE